MKEKKITKIAKIKHIQHHHKRRFISLICKTLDSTQNQQIEDVKILVQEKVPEKNNKQRKFKSLKKQRNTALSQSQQSSQSSQFMPDKQQIRVSETKNISTSYGKMILRFIQTKKQSITPILNENNVSYSEFHKTIQYFNKHMFSVSDLRKLWQDQFNKYSKIMRMFSMNFLRKHSYEYIFNSRIKMYERNLKYRNKIIQGVHNPNRFNMLKDF